MQLDAPLPTAYKFDEITTLMLKAKVLYKSLINSPHNYTNQMLHK